jgi:hypothetical protein
MNSAVCKVQVVSLGLEVLRSADACCLLELHLSEALDIRFAHLEVSQ